MFLRYLIFHQGFPLTLLMIKINLCSNYNHNLITIIWHPIPCRNVFLHTIVFYLYSIYSWSRVSVFCSQPLLGEGKWFAVMSMFGTHSEHSSQWVSGKSESKNNLSDFLTKTIHGSLLRFCIHSLNFWIYFLRLAHEYHILNNNLGQNHEMMPVLAYRILQVRI